MSKIPERVRIEAANALNLSENMPGSLFSERVDIVANAILAERNRATFAENKRCAKIAEEYDNCHPFSKAVSEAIRRR